jgi:hypothetical protein
VFFFNDDHLWTSLAFYEWGLCADCRNLVDCGCGGEFFAHCCPTSRLFAMNGARPHRADILDSLNILKTPGLVRRAISSSMRWNGMRRNRGRQSPGLATRCPANRYDPAKERPTEKDIHQGDPDSRVAISVHCPSRRQQIERNYKHEQKQVRGSQQIVGVSSHSQSNHEDRDKEKPTNCD